MIKTAALGLGLITGVALAVNLKLGVAFLLALVYTPLVFIDLPIAIALWVGLTFIDALPFVSVGPLMVAVLVTFGWIGTLRRENSLTRTLLKEHQRLIALLAVFVLWLLLSLIWAQKPGVANEMIWAWLTATALFIVVATGVNSERAVRLVLIAFVGGAVLSVVLGLTGIASNDLYTAPDALDTSGEASRLRGGSGDPNYLAAGLLPAAIIASGLIVSTRRIGAKICLSASMLLLLIGFASTESRGGAISAAVALLVGLFVVRRQRRMQLIAFVGVLIGFGVLWFAVNPSAWDRVSNFDSEGSGRNELWQVGWEVAKDHPVVGVGIGNFPVEAPGYVRRPGNLEFVNLIAERRLVVHNVYLQLLAETGIVGLGLFIALVVSSVRAAWMAAVRFDRAHRPAMATAARAVVIAAAAGLTSSFFISNTADRRLVVLLALGPALLALARRSPVPATPPRP